MSPEHAELAVFVVDDDPGARSSVAALIQSHGMKVRPFASAKEFLATYDLAQTGCLVVDVRMAGMTGLELQEDCEPRINPASHRHHRLCRRADGRARCGPAGDVPAKAVCRQRAVGQHRDGAPLARRSQQLRAQRNEILARRATLTPPEVEVLEKLMAGKANKVVASELDLGLRTRGTTPGNGNEKDAGRFAGGTRASDPNDRDRRGKRVG